MGELNNYLTFDGVSSAEYGIFISGEGVFNAPIRRGESVAIPGRNGALFIDGGSYENIEVTYPAFLARDGASAFANGLGAFRAELVSRTSYAKLVDTYHPTEYRMGIFRSGLTVEPTFYNRAGGFDLVFDCKPQRFLVAGDDAVPITSGDTLENPTLFVALPLINVEGVGTITIGNNTITVTGEAGQDLYIDCETMDAYTEVGGAISPANDLVSLNDTTFPSLGPGETGVTFTGFTSVEITPRWWTL